MLQREVDALSSKAAEVKGGLLVLGSLHLEMSAILEDRSAPLYNRTTDELPLGHLDTSSLVTLLRAHADATPERLLFLWTLFEGVPKFYRDCYEQGVLGADRKDLLNKIFFQSSSPLRTEADNWFLKELHGRYDVLLKYIARNPGCANGALTEHVKQVNPESSEQVGGYLKILLERYAIVERKLPIFAAKKERRGRYYLTDNFLRAWLAALASPASAINFVPVDRLVDEADQKLQGLEGFSLEKLSAQLYEERSRKSIGDFPLTSRIQGYWDRAGTEIDLVALDENSKRIRFGFCKRADEKLVSDLAGSEGHIARFLDALPEYRDWTIERVGIAPTMRGHVRHALQRAGYMSQDINDLIEGL